jgi:cobalamin synthase
VRAPGDDAGRRLLSALRTPATTRLLPLVGAVIGAASAAAFWLAAQLWPTSVAVILAVLVSALLSGDIAGRPAASRVDSIWNMFYVLIKYNLLMALSAAKLPFAAPANVALGVIMICGYAASRALIVSMTAGSKQSPLSHFDIIVALLLGFLPSTLLGIPGLVGLAAAILVSMSITLYLKHARPRAPLAAEAAIPAAQMLTETSFYLGALATWSYL